MHSVELQYCMKISAKHLSNYSNKLNHLVKENLHVITLT